MSDEVKEILDYLKDDNYFTESSEYEVSSYDLFKSLNRVQTDKLLDYITNLQEENERLKENKLTPDELANLLNQELIKQRDDYKSRCEKATKHIKEHTENIDRGKYYEDYVETYDLLNILNGGDE